ncbi:MAG: hypothetical protein E6Q95_00730 [Chitinophagaceae bacterium]|nr:MAG: hypothetical protein E6Q95_00730 [Chitinophagaceae bacterium]
MKKIIIAGLTLTVLFLACKKSNDPIKKDPEPSIPKPPIVILKTADSVIIIDEKLGGMKEANRLAQSFPASDFSPTGFYLAPGATMKLMVTSLKGTRMPELLIGTYSRNTARWNPSVRKLNAGVNTITDDIGGILYLRFNNDAPSDQVRIRFNEGMRPIPYFQLGKTKQDEWLSMLDSIKNVPDVQLVGEKTIITFSLDNAKKVKDEKMENLVKKADRVIRIEDSISGLFGTDPIDQPNIHKYLMTESDSPDYYMAATYFRTWYRSTDAVSAILRTASLTWGPWHELGHMHQQGAWTWSELTETTVNIYSMAVEKALGISPTRLTSQGEWSKAATYLAKPDAEKKFNESSVSVWTRLCMFQQLKLAFGDEFYHQLHRVARREMQKPNSTDAKMRWFMVNASSISGKNLSSFFKKWGMVLSTEALTDAAYTDIEKLGLPMPDQDLTLLKD